MRCGLTQSELAEGVISVSYLSKIENNQNYPSEEVYTLLYRRLGISPLEEENLGDFGLVQKCHIWFNALLNGCNKDRLTSLYKDIKKSIGNSKGHSMEFLIEIHKIRYYFILGDMPNATSQINTLLPMISSFNDREMYYWNKFRGNIMSYVTNPKKAVIFYTLANDQSGHLNFGKEELADLHYSLGVSFSTLRRTAEAIYYIKEALTVYQQAYNDKRCLQCHIVLGLSYRRINVFDKAIHHYHIAINLAKKVQDSNLIGLSYMNMGHLFSAKEDVQQSIHHYNQSLKFFTTNSDKALSLLGLTEEFYKRKEFVSAYECVTQGISLIEIHDDTSSTDTKLELFTYKYMLEKQYEDMEHFIKNKLLPILIERNNYVKIAHYSNILSKYYSDKKMYKKALLFERKVSLAYKEMGDI